MNFIKNNWYWLLIVLTLSFLLLRSADSRSQDKSRYENNVIALNDTVKYYKDSKDNVVAYNMALEVTNKELNDQLYYKDEVLKEMTDKYDKVNSAATIETETVIDSVFIPYEKKVPFDFERQFNITTKNYSLSGLSNQDGTLVERLSVPAKLRWVTGVKNRWSKSHYTTDIVSDNENLKIKDIKSQVITVKKKRFGVGFITGVDIKLQPIIGFGISYDLFQF